MVLSNHDADCFSCIVRVVGDLLKVVSAMTDHSERDEAARKYCIEGIFPAAFPALESIAFKAGADWAVKNDPRVLKLVEALVDIGKGMACSACSCSCHDHANDALAKADEIRGGE